jgi:hypothetical protein
MESAGASVGNPRQQEQFWAHLDAFLVMVRSMGWRFAVSPREIEPLKCVRHPIDACNAFNSESAFSRLSP